METVEYPDVLAPSLTLAVLLGSLALALEVSVDVLSVPVKYNYSYLIRKSQIEAFGFLFEKYRHLSLKVRMTVFGVGATLNRASPMTLEHR